MPSSLARSTIAAEVLRGCRAGVERVVPALLGADRPRAPGIVRARPACCPDPSGCATDRVHRRQVDHVEAHRGDVVEALRGPDDPARRPREHLVPGTDHGPFRSTHTGIGAEATRSDERSGVHISAPMLGYAATSKRVSCGPVRSRSASMAPARWSAISLVAPFALSSSRMAPSPSSTPTSRPASGELEHRRRGPRAPAVLPRLDHQLAARRSAPRTSTTLPPVTRGLRQRRLR